MKVIVTGATGFVGKQVVVQCIETPGISSIIVLSRRDIDEALSKNPKVHVILHQDFLSYPHDLLEQLKGSQGCIWCVRSCLVDCHTEKIARCLGGKVEDFPDVETARKVGVDFALAAANAFVRSIAPNGGKFQFVFCSGKGAEWDQQKKLWMFSDTRKLKVCISLCWMFRARLT